MIKAKHVDDCHVTHCDRLTSNQRCWSVNAGLWLGKLLPRQKQRSLSITRNSVHAIWQSVCCVVLYVGGSLGGKPSLSDVQELEPCTPAGLSCYERNNSDSFNCTTQVFYLVEY